MDKPTLRIDRKLHYDPKPPKILLSTDAAAKPGRIGCGYITTAGHFGLRAFSYREDSSCSVWVVIAELLAIYEPLCLLRDQYKTYDGIFIRTDSTEAIAWINKWKKGIERVPPGYSRTDSKGRPSRLVVLSRMFAKNTDINVAHQKAHIGEPLNEAADSLAKMALRYDGMNVNKRDLQRTATDWATNRLRDHNETVP